MQCGRDPREPAGAHTTAGRYRKSASAPLRPRKVPARLELIAPKAGAPCRTCDPAVGNQRPDPPAACYELRTVHAGRMLREVLGAVSLAGFLDLRAQGLKAVGWESP